MILPVSLFQLLIEKSLSTEQELNPFRDLSNDELFDCVKSRLHLNEDELLCMISEEMGVDYMALSTLFQDPESVQWLSLEQQSAHRVIPIYQHHNALFVCVDNPFNPFLTELSQQQSIELSTEQSTGQTVSMCLISSTEMSSFLARISEGGMSSLVTQWIVMGLSKRASDLHFNHTREGYDVYFRIHGILYKMGNIGETDATSFKAMMKLHSQMDIADLKKPQDGRLELAYHNQQVECRVSAIPTIHGEDFACRLADMNNDIPSFEELGFSQKAMTAIRYMMNQTSGLIVVTGATGSGKSTTLYTMLDELRQSTPLNIVTMEDPVEKVVPGIRQSPISEAAGYSFAKGLRAILRQDPDVIMVGEIRDEVSAKVALDAAYTGHLVIATLHTADCKSTLLRLQSLGLESFMVGYCLKGIISQRLVPKKCHCVRAGKQGCSRCHYSGFDGRSVVSEHIVCDGHDRFDMDQMEDGKHYYSFDHDIADKQARNII